VKVHLLGVRGSTPATGAEFARYGGHTSCVAIADDTGVPRLVLDAGTGIRQLGRLLGGEPFRGTICLGHLHWDHTQGLPFCPSIDRPGAQVRMLMPDQGDAEQVFNRAMSPPHFPIDIAGLRGDWEVAGLQPGRHEIEGYDVLALDIPHKGGRTFGFRIQGESGSIAYLSDHGPSAVAPGPDGWGEYHEAALALADGVDLLLHDAQHTAEELPTRVSFGHSAADYAVELGHRAGARTVVLFHHDPNREDDDMDRLVESFSDAPVHVIGAVEDDILSTATASSVGSTRDA
jgi:phosphoribosyl 1,2-cyclic phosphodiesterase